MEKFLWEPPVKRKEDSLLEDFSNARIVFLTMFLIRNGFFVKSIFTNLTTPIKLGSFKIRKNDLKALI